VWDLTGHVQITFTNEVASSNAVLSGLFFDPLSASSSAAPAAPTGLTATGGTSSVTLHWSEASTIQGFLIERSSDGVNFTQVDTTGPTASSYTDAGLPQGTKYYYRVRATNAVGTSAASSVASASTSAPSSATFVGIDATTQGD